MDFFASQLQQATPKVTDEYLWSLVIETGSGFGGTREELVVACKLESKKGKYEKAINSPPKRIPDLQWNFKVFQYPHRHVSGNYKGIRMKVKRKGGGGEVGTAYLDWERLGGPGGPPKGFCICVTDRGRNQIGEIKVLSTFHKYQQNARVNDFHDHSAQPGAPRSRTEQTVKKIWLSDDERTSRVTLSATGKREILVPTAGPAKFASYPELPKFNLESAGAKRVCFNNALWLCIAAQLAYKTEEIIYDVTRNVWDMDGCIFLEHKPTDTQGFIMHNNDVMVISFRGTETMTNWKSNAKFISIPGDFPPRYHQGGVRVHKGFHDALKMVWPQIVEAVNDVFSRIPHIKLYVCGHSLGGALATMCFAFLTLSDTPRPVAATYTIGQPRIGNKQFCNTLKKNSPNTVYVRITNNQDIVPSVPPSLCHFGINMHISPNGRFEENPRWRLNKEDITQQQSLVTDHPTACYRLLIEQEYARREANRLGNSSDLYNNYERAILFIDMILEGVKGVHFGRTQLYAIVAQVFQLKPLLDAASEYFVLIGVRQKQQMEAQFQELNKFLVELQAVINKFRKKANAKSGIFGPKEKSFNEKMTKFCGTIQPVCNRINQLLLEVNQSENFVNDVLVKGSLEVKKYDPAIYRVEFTSINFGSMTNNQAMDEAGAQIQELLDVAEKHIDEGELEEAVKILTPISDMDSFENFATNHQRSTHSFLLAKATAQLNSQTEANEVLTVLKSQPELPKITPPPGFQASLSPSPYQSMPVQRNAPAHHGGSAYSTMQAPSSAYQTSPNMPPVSPYNVSGRNFKPSGAGSRSEPQIPAASSQGGGSLGSIRSMGQNPYATSSGVSPKSSSPNAARNFQSPAGSSPGGSSPGGSGNYGSYQNFSAAQKSAGVTPAPATGSIASSYGSYGNYNAAQQSAGANPPQAAPAGSIAAASSSYGSYGNYNAAQQSAGATPAAGSIASSYGSYGNYNAAQQSAGANPNPAPAAGGIAAAGASYGSYRNFAQQSAGANPPPGGNYASYKPPGAVPQGGAPGANLYSFRGNSSAYGSAVPKNP